MSRPSAAPGRHVAAHDPVAALGHPGNVLAAPLGLEAQAEHADAERGGDRAHLIEVLVHLAAGLVQGLDRGAGQLDLAARLEGDAGAAPLQRDRPLVFRDHLPAELPGQTFEQRPDAPFALVRQRPQVVVRIAELLVLGADAPLGLRLAAGLEVFDQLATIGDRRALRLRRRGHAVLPALVCLTPGSVDRASPYKGAASACQAWSRAQARRPATTSLVRHPVAGQAAALSAVLLTSDNAIWFSFWSATFSSFRSARAAGRRPGARAPGPARAPSRSSRSRSARPCGPR